MLFLIVFYPGCDTVELGKQNEKVVIIVPSVRQCTTKLPYARHIPESQSTMV